MKNYKTEYDHLVRLNKGLENRLPDTMTGFTKLVRQHSMDGALKARTKELIALGIAVAGHSEGCMISHLQHALELGVTREEIMEVLSVSVMMGGSPALIMAGATLEAMDQILDEKSPAHLFEHSDAVDSWGWS